MNQKPVTPPPTPAADSEYRERITKWMDFSADPCTGIIIVIIIITFIFICSIGKLLLLDFYEYSCGGFIGNTVLPPNVNSYAPIFNEVAVSH